jgi:hypothetical protein
LVAGRRPGDLAARVEAAQQVGAARAGEIPDPASVGAVRVAGGPDPEEVGSLPPEEAGRARGRLALAGASDPHRAAARRS